VTRLPRPHPARRHQQLSISIHAASHSSLPCPLRISQITPSLFSRRTRTESDGFGGRRARLLIEWIQAEHGRWAGLLPHFLIMKREACPQRPGTSARL
jgi:hypothetical protein